MAISTLRLNVAANTSRALADFNKFSKSLDNKFLISGLKLDVVRNALSQINRDFTRAIGEQGLASASSFRAAQNQAALLTQTFKGFSAASAMAITTDIGTALNKVAVQAGGTMKDVQKTMAATPFISTRISQDLRDSLTRGMMEFNRDFRRAGVGDNFSGMAQQFLMGRATGKQLIESGDPLGAFLGGEIVKRAGGEGYVFDPAERSRIMEEITGDKELREQLRLMARRTAGFRIVLEDLNTYLFNPEAGVFGSLRKVIDSAGKSTTMFEEVEKLAESVFGEKGMFAKLSEAIRSVFGDFDPMRPFIDGVQLMGGVFEKIGNYFQTTGFKNIVEVAKEVFDGVSKVFKGLYNQIKSGNFDANQITEGVKEFNKAIREYVKDLGKTIRGESVSKQSEFAGTVMGTLVEEIGKTSIVLIKELFYTFINKVPEIATKVLPALNDGINKMLTEVFGNELAGKVLKFVLGFVPGPVGQIARASTAGDLTGGGGNVLSMLAMGGAALLGPKMMLGLAKGAGGLGLGALGLIGRIGTQRGRYDTLSQLGSRAQGLETYLNRTLYMDRLVTDKSGRTMSINRFSPLSRRIIDPLSARMRPSSVLPEREWFNLLSRGGGFTPPFNYGMDPNFTGRMSLNDLNAFRRGPIIPYPAIGSESRFNFSLDPGDNSRSRSYSNRYAPGNLIRGARVGNFMRRIKEGIRNYSYEGTLEEYERRGLVPRGYVTPAGPQPWTPPDQKGPPWAPDPRYKGLNPAINEDFAPYMESGTAYSFEKTGRIGVRENLASRINRRYGSGGRRAVLKRNIGRIGRRFGKKALIGTIIGAGAIGLFAGKAKASEPVFDPTTGQFIQPEAQQGPDLSGVGSVLGGGFEGAMTGAAIGTAIPVIGTAAGAAIGGIIGGILPLMDEGVKDSVGKFVEGLKTNFGNTVEWFTTGTKENFEKVIGAIGSVMKFFVNGIISTLNFALNGFQTIPRMISGIVEFIYEKTPGLSMIPGLGAAVKAGKFLANFQIPNFASGKNYLGPALSLEARMSGRNPMVVNDSEFVIPKDGFPILAGLVGQNLRTTGVINPSPPQPVQINVSLSLTAHSVVANADELAETLKEPVMQIMDDAWTEYQNSRVPRANTVA